MRWTTHFIAAAVLLGVAGCQKKAPTGASEAVIVAAYNRALVDGQFIDHLKPYVHPDLVARIGEAPMLGNREPSTAKTLIGQVLQPAKPDQIKTLQSFFDFPVPPTHVLELTVEAKPDAQTTLTSRSPLHLVAAEGGYFIVFGVLKSGLTKPSGPPPESYTFSEEAGPWRHLWELQPAPDAKATYRLEVRAVTDDQIVATLLTTEQTAKAAGRGPIRFRLWSNDAEAPYEPSTTGDSIVPFAYQAGSTAGADQFTIDAVALNAYAPMREPAFDCDRMLLATLAGEVDGERRAFVIEWVRE